MMTDASTLTAQHTVLATAIGDLTVVREDDLLTGLYFPHHWYKPDPAYKDSRLTKIDKENIKLVQSVEESMGGAINDAQHEADLHQCV